MQKNPLKMFLVFFLAELSLLLFAVWFFDPFYQYHKPFFGEAVLNDRDNQMPGTIRNFDYDSVLLGSSVAENFDQTYLDGQYGIQTLKIIRASGSAADLMYYLEVARSRKEKEGGGLKKVFWCLDLFSLDAGTTPTLRQGNDTPWYLHTKTVLDDVTYLCNKEILLQTIPKNLVSGLKQINTGGNAYNWADGKNFGASYMMRAYQKPAASEVLPEADWEGDLQKIRENLEKIVKEAESHPETEYVFFYPPYSMAWWDCAYVNGLRGKDLSILELSMERLTALSNAEVFFYMDLPEILDLDNYMDLLHYRPEINRLMLEKIVSGEGFVTAENREEKMREMKNLTERISGEEIYRYYPKE